MIFFGTRGKTVAGQALTGIQCPSCQNNSFTSFGVQRYFHLYWIPTIPTKKHVGVECSNCRHTLLNDEIPPHMIGDIRESVFSGRTMLPMYSGLFIIAALVGFLFYLTGQDKAREAAYLEQPAVSDYYVVDYTKIFEDTDPDYKFGVMRVTAIEGDEIGFQLSNYSYNVASGVRDDIRDGEATQDEYYDAEEVWFYKSSLVEMQGDGTIRSIERN